MNAPAVVRKESLPALAVSEQELMGVLRNSLYPGARDESIKLVIEYCKASGLDPMQKPVHIVPMDVSTGKKDSKGWDIKEKRDVIMPGIGLYRTQAARSGEYAGVSEPVFGPDVEKAFDELKMTFPAWCRITIKRVLPSGQIAEFSATERWEENYATGRNTTAPNAMWKRRPYAQLAKCAEAQALRKAFPEIGAQPTADEMEGKSLDEEGAVIDGATGEIVGKEPKAKELPPLPDARIDSPKQPYAGKDPEQIIGMFSTRFTVSDAQKERIRAACRTPAPEKAIEGEVILNKDPNAESGMFADEDAPF